MNIEQATLFIGLPLFVILIAWLFYILGYEKGDHKAIIRARKAMTRYLTRGERIRGNTELENALRIYEEAILRENNVDFEKVRQMLKDIGDTNLNDLPDDLEQLFYDKYFKK